MNDKTLKKQTQLLEYIMDDCEIIAQYLLQIDTRECFLQNKMTQDATAMRMLNIGECVKQLIPEVKNAGTKLESNRNVKETTNWKGLAGVRDYIAHEYNNVDVDILYDVVTVEIPQLYKTCKELYPYVIENKLEAIKNNTTQITHE